MATISLARALKRLKMTETRLDTIVSGARGTAFVAITRKDGERTLVNGSNTPVEDATKEIKANFDRFQSLIEYRDKLKSAIILANATTKVKVGEKDLTIAEIIDLRTAIKYRRTFIETLKRQYDEVLRQESSQNDELRRRINSQAADVFQGNVSTEDATKFINERFEAGKTEILDPSNIEDTIRKGRDFLLKWDNELDEALQEVNAATQIEVPDDVE